MKEKSLVSLKTQIIGGHGTQMKKLKKKGREADLKVERKKVEVPKGELMAEEIEEEEGVIKVIEEMIDKNMEEGEIMMTEISTIMIEETKGMMMIVMEIKVEVEAIVIQIIMWVEMENLEVMEGGQEEVVEEETELRLILLIS